MKPIRYSDYSNRPSQFDRYTIDGIHAPRRQRPMPLGEPDYQKLHKGLFYGVVIGLVFWACFGAAVLRWGLA